jgi:riboflavin synthase alpha subunit|tara:strand:- start:132 stop:542 length:411 start_codon:yes stop_codon:yes gene_type:complete
MILNEFIKETQKNQMISTLLKHYGVGSVKMKMKSMKDHAHYNVDKGFLELSNKYKTIKDSQTKEFLITIIHEIRHAMDAKKYGWRKFKDMYEMEMNLMVQQGKDPYDDNKYEIDAEEFGQNNWKKWYNTFKKEGLI